MLPNNYKFVLASRIAFGSMFAFNLYILNKELNK